jgi:hypothetical protein
MRIWRSSGTALLQNRLLSPSGGLNATVVWTYRLNAAFMKSGTVRDLICAMFAEPLSMPVSVDVYYVQVWLGAALRRQAVVWCSTRVEAF